MNYKQSHNRIQNGISLDLYNYEYVYSCACTLYLALVHEKETVIYDAKGNDVFLHGAQQPATGELM